MSTIEKIQKYIDRAKIDRTVKSRYDMAIDEACALCEETENDNFSAICLAFDYGRAKGYRAAKAEGKA